MYPSARELIIPSKGKGSTYPASKLLSSHQQLKFQMSFRQLLHDEQVIIIYIFTHVWYYNPLCTLCLLYVDAEYTVTLHLSISTFYQFQRIKQNFIHSSIWVPFGSHNLTLTPLITKTTREKKNNSSTTIVNDDTCCGSPGMVE